jgi:hypothetical protein
MDWNHVSSPKGRLRLMLQRTNLIASLAAAIIASSAVASAADLSVTDYSSIQEALDANPGRLIFVPAGDYTITEKIRVRGDRAGLFGPGRIVQQNSDQPIIEIEDARGAEIRDLTLTRPAGKRETGCEGVLAIRCRDLVIDHVRVIDNRTRSSAIALRECRDSRVSRCHVRNYMRVSIDDRTGSEDWGYAFRCTDGSGITVSYSTGTLIEGNRVIEDNLVPTPELKAKHKLVDVVVQGNVIQSVGKPRYQYAVVIAGGPNTPRGLHFSNNLFHPGSRGVANKDLPP